jgi:2-polyprenyl-3-methyl-5-hydroxy-6-metoxy-1,4-benzoquinol methylase
MEALATCLACGAPSARARAVHRRKDDTLVRCPECRLMYAQPQYEPAELDELYRVEYYDEHKNLQTDYRERDYRSSQPLNRLVVDDLLERYPRLRAQAGRAVRALDFGSGVGFFMDACRERGLEPLGMDFSEVASRYAKQRFGLEVRVPPDEALRALPDASFELVTAWQVVEHLRRPRETLVELQRVLEPGGVLCITVPNLRSLYYRVQGARWFNIVNPTHLAFFDQRSLTRLLRALGLVGVHRPVFWGGRPGFGPVRNLVQYAFRIANLGNELRLYATKPAVR